MEYLVHVSVSEEDSDVYLMNILLAIVFVEGRGKK